MVSTIRKLNKSTDRVCFSRRTRVYFSSKYLIILVFRLRCVKFHFQSYIRLQMKFRFSNSVGFYDRLHVNVQCSFNVYRPKCLVYCTVDGKLDSYTNPNRALLRIKLSQRVLANIIFDQVEGHLPTDTVERSAGSATRHIV